MESEMATGTMSLERTRGQKAGLTRQIIIAKAIDLVEQNPALTIVAIAAALKVVPAAIYAHFPGRMSEILTETVRKSLVGIARPFDPKETWEDYVRQLFVATSRAFHGRRNVSIFVANELSTDYYLNPLLVERVLLALRLAGIPTEARARAFDVAMSALVGFISIECSALGKLPASKWVKTVSAAIDQLPAGEHPEITGLKQELLEAAVERSAQVGMSEPSLTRVHRFADQLIAGLKAQSAIAA